MELLKDYLNKKAIYIPTYGFIFNRESALEFLNMLKKKDYYVVGGDVLKKNDKDEYSYTYDSWHSEPPNETRQESIQKAIEYISNYPYNSNIYFVLSWVDKIELDELVKMQEDINSKKKKNKGLSLLLARDRGNFN